LGKTLINNIIGVLKNEYQISLKIKMKSELTQLINNAQLNHKKAYEMMKEIADGNVNQAQLSSFLSIFLIRGLSLEEMRGFIDSLNELAISINIPFKTCDIVGTGGDGKNTINISTISAIIAAGAGVKVTKHGNYGVSSVSGSSNVLEHMGYVFPKNESEILTQLEKNSIAFIHAPLFHPSLKHAAETRKNLGLRSLFNLAGPLVNPCNPYYKVLGVYNLETFRLYHYLLQENDSPYKLIYNLDGYDEISLTDTVKIGDRGGEHYLSPNDLGFNTVNHNEISCSTNIEDAAYMFKKIINNKGTNAQEQVCLANAALAIELFYQITYKEACQRAKESLKSGNASKILSNLLTQ
jgi:anthranilate phosphoribosyltransferase